MFQYKCNFCAATVTHGNILRSRTLQDVWDELDSLETRLPNIKTIWVKQNKIINKKKKINKYLLNENLTYL